jgi:uncharacterized damage-inducible protein DinB
MHPMDGLAGAMHWVGPDLARQLDFIPDDKLDWKPAPEAKSALACAAEAAYVMRGALDLLDGKPFTLQIPENLTKAQVQEALRANSAEYAGRLPQFPPEKLGEDVVTPFATMPWQQMLTYVVIEAAHHRGQVCYIQTLLGDTELHF